jgi:hypothetical protein
MPSSLSALAEELVVYDADRSPERVTLARLGVGDTRRLTDGPRVAAMARDLLVDATVSLFAGATLRPLDQANALADRLVRIVDEAGGRSTVRICGSELVGAEEPAAAESRALSMRERLAAELQRALSDEPPATVRQSVPFSSAEAR